MYRVLVVDDEKYIRKSIVNLTDWEACGMEPCGEAEDGAEALGLIAAGPVPDIVITDIRMPGMDGLELAERIAAEHPQVRVVIVSAYSDFAYAQTAIRAGVRDYLLKPVDQEELEAVLRKLRAELDGEAARRKQYSAGTVLVESAEEGRYDVLAEIRRDVRLRYMEDISVGRFAQERHVNLSWLSAAFKERYGEGLSAYIESTRMEHAKALLLEADRNITETALATGYADSNYFTKVFRKYTGMTPREWRRTLGGGTTLTDKTAGGFCGAQPFFVAQITRVFWG